MSRIVIFVGRFGSGKTETALNYALALAANGARQIGPDGLGLWLAGLRGRGEPSGAALPPSGTEAVGRESEPVALIDLDIVTPFFRSRELASQLRARGVHVVAPLPVGLHLDLAAISPQILGAIQDQRRRVVLDVGGDPQGARALGQFSAAIRDRGYTMLMLVNPFRPFTDTLEGIAEAVEAIQAESRLSVTALVSNPNLMHETTRGDIERGHALVQEAGRRLGLPVAWLVVEETLAATVAGLQQSVPIFPIARHFVSVWQQ